MNKPTDTQHEDWVKIDDRKWETATGKAINCSQAQADEMRRATRALMDDDFTLINELRRCEAKVLGGST